MGAQNIASNVVDVVHFLNVRDGAKTGNGGTTTGSVIESFLVSCGPSEACFSASVTVSTQDGEFISSGTCPDVPGAPWVCSVPNVPRGITVMITLDDIAPGYVIEQHPLYWDTSQEPSPQPGVGPGVPSFTLVPSDARSPLGPSASTESVTLLMTFRACPEGFNPEWDDFFVNCTIPLDAPDTSFLYHGGDAEGGMNIMWLDRQHNGEYVFKAGPYTMNLELMGLAPEVRDAYEVVGANAVDGGTNTVYLGDGEVREISVFYYFYP